MEDVLWYFSRLGPQTLMSRRYSQLEVSQRLLVCIQIIRFGLKDMLI